MGVSENSVPHLPNGFADHYQIIPMKNGYFIGNINPTFSDKPISPRHISKGHVVPIFHLRFPRHQRCQHRAQRGQGQSGQRSGRDRGVKGPGRSLVRCHTGGDMLHPWWICGFLGDSDGISTIKIGINPINMEFGRGLNRGNK